MQPEKKSDFCYLLTDKPTSGFRFFKKQLNKQTKTIVLASSAKDASRKTVQGKGKQGVAILLV